MKALPVQWENTTWGQLSEWITYGFTRPMPHVSEGVPIVTAKNVRHGRIDFTKVHYTTEEAFNDLSDKDRPKAGDILITKDGSIGHAAVVPEDVKFCINQSVAVIWLRESKANRGYLLHAVHSDNVQRQIAREARGVALKHLSVVDFGRMHLPLPPLPEQKRIAAILDKADEIRRKRAQAIKLTEELLRSTFLKICGPNAVDYESWPEMTIESLSKSEKGSMRTGPFGSDLRHSEFVDTGVAVLGIDNAVQNRFAWGQRRFISEKKYEKLQRYTVKSGDVIVTIMGTTGRTAVVPEDIPLSITTKHLATISLDRTKAEPEFVAQSLHRHPSVLQQIENAHRGAIMKGLNLGLIKSLVLRVPPLSAQQRFSAVTGQIREQSEAMCQGVEDELVGSLTQRAFRGEL